MIHIESIYCVSSEMQKAFDIENEEVEELEYLFECDPDYIKVDGYLIPFISYQDNNKNWWVLVDGGLDVEVEDALFKFFSKNFKEHYEAIEGGWDAFEKEKNIIAFRGGCGKIYTLWKMNDKE